jgi:hypothetical protein
MVAMILAGQRIQGVSIEARHPKFVGSIASRTIGTVAKSRWKWRPLEVAFLKRQPREKKFVLKRTFRVRSAEDGVAHAVAQGAMLTRRPVCHAPVRFPTSIRQMSSLMKLAGSPLQPPPLLGRKGLMITRMIFTMRFLHGTTKSK